MGLSRVYDVCAAREDVLTGSLLETEFAARLLDVVGDRGPAIYREPALFFENTFKTAGLQAVIDEVFGRLSARPGKASGGTGLIRLETSFGGGKTHNLIALFHLAKHAAAVPAVHDWLSPSLQPQHAVKVVALVGDELGTAVAYEHEDGQKTYTLWGELAYQLGNYELMRARDEQRDIPEGSLLQQVVGNEPTLVMIDELALYLRKAKTKVLGSSDLAAATIPFLQSLFGLASSKPNLVVVITLADSRDAYAQETETLKRKVDEEREAQRVSAREEKVFNPTRDDEYAEVIKRRLFSSVDSHAAQETAAAYGAYYHKAYEQEQVALRDNVTSADYLKNLKRSYPLHPALIEVLSQKVSTIPNFQRTRGLLRLLALVIRRVWQLKEPDAYVIQPHHVDLSDPEICAELTGRLDKGGFKPVIEADIFRSDGSSHAQLRDAQWTAIGQPPVCRQVAQTVFLHSLVWHGSDAKRGAEEGEVNLAVGRPGLDFALIKQALGYLEDRGWHFHALGSLYRFQTEPSIPRIIDEERGNITIATAKEEIRKRLIEYYPDKQFDVVHFPDMPAGVDDDAKQPKLVLMHFDAAEVTEAGGTPPLVTKLFEHAGSQGSFRQYQNNLVFLVAAKEELSSMIEAAQKNLALKRLTGPPRSSDFTKDQLKKLSETLGKAELELRVAITRAYRNLFYPEGNNNGLKHYVLQIQEAVDPKQDRQAELIRVLADLKKVLRGDDAPLSPEYVKAKAWSQGQQEMSAADLQKTFCKRRSLPIVLDPEQIKKTIRKGIADGIWAYWDGAKAFHKDTALPDVQLTEGATLYTPEKAEELGLLKPPPPPEPVKPPQPPVQAPVLPFTPPPPPPGAVVKTAVPSKAITEMVDACQEKKIAKLSGLEILVSAPEDVLAVVQAVNSLGDLPLKLEHTLVSQFEQDYARFDYRGQLKRFNRVWQASRAFIEEAVQQKQNISATLTLSLTFAVPLAPDGEIIQRVRQALDAVALGPVTVTAIPFTGKEGQ
jgi:hypothetical protein